MAFVIWFVAWSLIVIALTAMLNVLIFPRIGKRRAETGADVFVSVLIPARDEAANIGGTVSALLQQDYTHFELILLDDHSTDGTVEVARAAADGDARLRVINGELLPEGWLGKNWACHQLANVATGDLLVFFDADVKFEEHALSSLLTEVVAMDADLLSVWPTQQTVTWGERLCVPLMALVILGYLPVIMVHRTPFRSLAAANGQCMVFRREAYDVVGGHASVRGEIVEDVMLARRIKAAGLNLRMADGAGVVGCRMYESWGGVRDGFAKNILAGYGDSVLFLALATVFHWLIFVFPVVWLVIGVMMGTQIVVPAALTVLAVGVRALTAKATHQRVSDAILMPVSVLMMTVISVQAVWWRWRYGGPRWKGRVIKQSKRTQSSEVSEVVPLVGDNST